MGRIDTSQLYVALMHHPVYNKTGAIVTTAITNLDLHDIARTATTFALGGYYVVNPQPAQRELAGRITAHWVSGFGAEYNPNRGEALGNIRIVPELSDALDDIEQRCGKRPKTIATAAKGAEGAVGYNRMRETLEEGGPHVLLFGTGWGLTREFLASCDYMLKPIEGLGGYNHLPVRSAVAIILDRLLSNR